MGKGSIIKIRRAIRLFFSLLSHATRSFAFIASEELVAVFEINYRKFYEPHVTTLVNLTSTRPPVTALARKVLHKSLDGFAQ